VYQSTGTQREREIAYHSKAEVSTTRRIGDDFVHDDLDLGGRQTHDGEKMFDVIARRGRLMVSARPGNAQSSRLWRSHWWNGTGSAKRERSCDRRNVGCEFEERHSRQAVPYR
jgi:hypothetical protein